MEFNKNKSLEELIAGLDISPTMHRNAEEKYKAVASYLENKGLNCEIYPQGSFAIGTVVRPYKEGKEQNYDLDFICLVKDYENSESPLILRNLIGNQLKQHKTYNDMLKEYEKCWTLEYGTIGTIGFNMDIIPAIEEEETFILITDKNLDTNLTKWIKSNPAGYVKWFEEINFLYPQYNRMKIANESVQELPSAFERTSLQKVIQILKVHRDSYYYKRRKEKKKVISSIITTLCAQIARENLHFTSFDTLDLLSYIVKELKIYSHYLTAEALDLRYNDKKVIKKNFSKWEILNPVNPDDNLADQWNEDPEKAELFFDWIENINQEFVEKKDIEYLYALESVFGESYVENKLASSNLKRLLEISKEKKEITPSKPWRK